MNLIVDIGNSRVKLCLFSHNEIAHFQVIEFDDVDALHRFCHNQNIECGIVSSVVTINPEFLTAIKQLCSHKCLVLERETPLPIQNIYATPQTLGLDRIAAAVGVFSISPNKHSLIIDAGTAITIDYLNADNQYVGGNISPGLNTRFKALNSFTNKLPLLDFKTPWQMIGDSTETAIITGVQQGILFELEGYIDYFSQKYTDIQIFVTGGDAEFIHTYLQKKTQFEPMLVLKGLNRILYYNEFEK